MARKFMTKEITHTTVKVARIGQDENGMPVAEHLPEVTLIGNVTLEKAQKEILKKLGAGVTVFGVEADTQTYELAVEDFLKHAHIKKDGEEEPENEQQSA